MIQQFEQVKAASKAIARLTDQQRNKVLEALADAILKEKDTILQANELDLARMDKSSPLYDRLQLTESRLEAIAGDMRNVAHLPSPLGQVSQQRVLENGLRLCRTSVPFGVIWLWRRF